MENESRPRPIIAIVLYVLSWPTLLGGGFMVFNSLSIGGNAVPEAYAWSRALFDEGIASIIAALVGFALAAVINLLADIRGLLRRGNASQSG